jgi:hypothetical protein
MSAGRRLWLDYPIQIAACCVLRISRMYIVYYPRHDDDDTHVFTNILSPIVSGRFVSQLT